MAAVLLCLALTPRLVLAQSAPTPASAAVTAQSAAPSGASPAGAASGGEAQLTPEEQAALQEAIIKASQNPVGNIAIVPFQNNFNFGAGPYQRLQYNLNIQPVVPIMLSPSWNLIARSIIPIINNPSSLPPSVCDPLGGCGTTFGIGDLNQQFYFAPRTRPGGIIWGAGPQFQFPTAAPATLGLGKYSVGPDIVGLIMPGPWVIGTLVTQLWSVGGDPTRPAVSNFLIQPFANYNFKGGWAISSAPSITANWVATPQQGKWLVPLGGGVVKTFKLGTSPMQLGLLYYANVARPTNAPSGQLRLDWALLFPIKRGAALPK